MELTLRGKLLTGVELCSSRDPLQLSPATVSTLLVKKIKYKLVDWRYK